MLLPLNSSLKVLFFRKELNCTVFQREGEGGEGEGGVNKTAFQREREGEGVAIKQLSKEREKGRGWQ